MQWNSGTFKLCSAVALEKQAKLGRLFTQLISENIPPMLINLVSSLSEIQV